MTKRLAKSSLLSQLVGKHIDEVLALASKNGFGVNVVYAGRVRSAGRRILTVRVDDKDLVISAR